MTNENVDLPQTAGVEVDQTGYPLFVFTFYPATTPAQVTARLANWPDTDPLDLPLMVAVMTNSILGSHNDASRAYFDTDPRWQPYKGAVAAWEARKRPDMAVGTKITVALSDRTHRFELVEEAGGERWRRLEAPVPTDRQIVQKLASCSPVGLDGSENPICVLCRADDYDSTGHTVELDDPANHAPECPWRLAKETP